MTAFSKWMLGFAMTLGASSVWAGGSGTSVWGEEAREVYDTLVALGATKVVIPEGPTVIIDDVSCVKTDMGTTATARCVFKGDPALSAAEGVGALRLIKALLAMGIKFKSTSPETISLGVTALDCGVLHNVNGLRQTAQQKGVASCFFVDKN